MRTETKFNKIVNVAEDGKITVLDYIFKHEDGFKGATGYKFYPVSREEYEKATDRENMIDYLIKSGLELPDNFKRGGFEQWVDAILDAHEEGELMFDTSYSNLWDYLREELNLTEDEAFIFDCVGGVDVVLTLISKALTIKNCIN